MKIQRISWILLACFSISLSCKSLQQNLQRPQQKEIMIKVTDLRCEYQTHPIGLDETQPRLSWKLQSTERGQKQTAYRVLVASSQENLGKDLGDLWDSGKLDSDQSTHVIYQGKSLQSRMHCYWKVRVWDKGGKPTPWAEAAEWSMGLLQPEDWKAKWIGLNQVAIAEEFREKSNEDAHSLKDSDWIWYPDETDTLSVPPGTCYFRRVIEIPSDQAIEKAQFVLTADNQFVLWFNGKQVGNGSQWQDLHKIDLSSHIKNGKNIIAIEAENIGNEPNPAGLIGTLHLQFSDGDEITLNTNPEWRVSKDNVPEWEKPDFDDSQWVQAKGLGKFGMAPWGSYAIDRRRLPALYLRDEFSSEKKINKARVYISGLGYYKLFLNGNRVGDHEIDPILRDYSKQTPYVTYDVSEFIKNGDNAIGVMLGCGRFYAPHPEKPTYTRDFGLPRLLFQLEIEYDDGSCKVLTSDDHWLITDKGPILNNNDYDGEYYDARKEMPGWDRVGFDPIGWKKVDLVSPPEGSLTSAALMQPMRVTGEIHPIQLSEPEPDVWVFDLGQNMVGRCRLKVKGPAGTKVKMHFAENVYPSGMLDYRNLRLAECLDTYILKGEGEETYTPSFTYHGFRYIEVTGFPGKPTRETLTGEILNTDMAFTGKFECSNPTITQLLKNARWGIRGNYLSIPTDCPQRDERHGWQGDRAGEQVGEAYLFDNILLYEKWMGDVRDSQQEDGNLSDVCPNFWPLYRTNVTWPSSFVIIPGNLYQHYGDLRAIENNYDTMKRWMDHLRGFLDDGIIAKDNYGDWCCPPESKELIHSRQPWRRTPAEVLATSYFYHNLILLSEYAELLGKEQDAQMFRAEAADIYEAFNKNLYDQEGGFYGNGSQTSQILPLKFGLVPKNHQKKIIDYTIHHIETKTNNHIGTGLIGGQWLMRTLTERGYGDLAYRLATYRDYPSWGYMIDHGATTIWELWNGDTANPAMNSGNHVMLLGDVVIWMFEHLGGIKSDIDQPGFKHILMNPQIVGDLKYAKAEYDSLYGKIVSDWKIEEDVFQWDVVIPVNTSATLSIPTKNPADVKESGRNIGEEEGIAYLGMEQGKAIYRIGSGKYHFESSGIGK